MAYSKQTWENLPNRTTPFTAERMTHIEEGIYDNCTDIATLEADVEQINEDLEDYALVTEAGYSVQLVLDNSTYQLQAKLKDKSGTVITSSNVIDLPIEQLVANIYYDENTKEIVFVLKSGTEVRVSIADIVSGLQTEITEQNKLSSDLVDDTNHTHKFVSTSEKTTWNAKYAKPSGGIPKTDLASAVQTSLGKADTALQQHQDISGKEDKSNKVTSISEESTDTQYPSAKAVYTKEQETKADLENQLEETNAQLDQYKKIFNALPKVNGSGEVITLDNTAETPLKMELSGNTSQETTSISGGDEYDSPSPDYPQDIEVVTGDNTIKVEGKNLLSITENSSLIHCTYVSGANTNQYKLLCTASDMHVNNISGVGSSYNTDKGNLISCNYGETIYFDTGNSLFTKNYFNEWDENLVSLGYYRKSSSSGSYTPTNANCKYVTLRFGYDIGAVPQTTYTLAPIVSKSAISEYEPYQSQEYSVNLGSLELCKIGDYKDKIKRSSGKNLFDKDSATTQVGYFTSTGELKSEGDSTVITSYVEIEPNTNYYLSGITTENICFYDENKTFIERATGTIHSINKNAHFIRFQSATSNFNLNKIQLEKGSQATTYEPFGKVWCKYQEIRHLSLAIADMDNNDNYPGWRDQNQLKTDVFDGTITGSLSAYTNFYTNITSFNSDGVKINFNNQSTLYFLKSKFNEMSQTDWTTNYPNLVFDMYYNLATPTNEPITDTTLINQLDLLEKAYAYQNQTNISQQNNDKPFVIDAETLLDISNLENRVTLLED